MNPDVLALFWVVVGIALIFCGAVMLSVRRD